MHRSAVRLILALLLLLPLSAASAQPQTTTSPVKSKNDVGGSTIKQSATGLYIVQFADAPLASYRGGTRGLPATSPRATGDRALNSESSNSRAYRAYLGTQRQSVLRSIARTIGRQPQVVETYDTSFNGVALRISRSQAQQIQSLPGVKRVAPDMLQKIHTDVGPGFIGAAQTTTDHAPALFRSTLSGSQETPPNATTGTGAAIYTYNATSKLLTFQVSYSGLTGPATAAHIHSGAVGVAGPVLYPLTITAPGAIMGSVTLSDADQALLYAKGLYVNIHTAANPNGEIRGQINTDQGEGVIVGVLDTGINFGHKSFAPSGTDGYTVTNPLGEGKYKGACDPTNLPSFASGNPTGYDPKIICNSKLIGAWTFTQTAVLTDPLGLPSPADEDGHGSHTSSTAAGNIVSSEIIIPSVSGPDTVVDTGTVGGVAPHANIIMYDVCGTADSADCPNSTSLLAVDQAIKDGVNVINFSIGGSSVDPWQDFLAQGFLGAFDAGIAVSVSAGNDGPGAETVGSPSNAPWVMSAAASTHNRKYINSLTSLAGGSNIPPTLVGQGFSLGTSGSLPIVYAGAAPYTNPLCLPFPAGTDLSGKIVICDRGQNGRVEKSENVANAGGSGFVLANNKASGNELIGDIYPLPGVHITYDDGVILKAWVASSGTHTGVITGETKNLDASNGDIMTSFSSRGPDATALDVLKPDVTAPGSSVLAAFRNDDPNRDEFVFESGTSMSSPHTAGSLALLHAAHPDWTPSELFSALTTTAVTTVKNNDGTAAGPFDDGSGRINVSQAALAGLVLDETTQNYVDADPSADGTPSTLNRPSLMNSQCVVACSWTRTVRNTLPMAATWNASTTVVSNALSLTVSPASFTIAPGASQTITVTANVERVALNEYTNGAVVLTEAANLAPSAHLPVVTKPVGSDLPTSLKINSQASTGTRIIPDVHAIAISSGTVNVYGLTKATYTDATVAQASNPASPPSNLADGTSLHNVTVPEGTVRFVSEVITTTAEDLDLYIYLDGSDGSTPDGVPQPDELVAACATGVALEYCNIDHPDAGTYIVLVQNYQSSAAGKDTFTLSTGVVPAQSAGNMTVTVPTSQPANQAFTAKVSWNLQRTPGDRWYGAFDIGTDPANSGNLGYTKVDLIGGTTKIYLPLIIRQ